MGAPPPKVYVLYGCDDGDMAATTVTDLAKCWTGRGSIAEYVPAAVADLLRNQVAELLEAAERLIDATAPPGAAFPEAQHTELTLLEFAATRARVGGSRP